MIIEEIKIDRQLGSKREREWERQLGSKRERERDN